MINNGVDLIKYGVCVLLHLDDDAMSSEEMLHMETSQVQGSPLWLLDSIIWSSFSGRLRGKSPFGD